MLWRRTQPLTDRQRRLAAATAAAVALAAPAEGLRQVAYRDPVGVLTVCYGSTTNVDTGRLYSRAECEAMLTAEMREAVDQVERCVPGLPWNQLAAWGDAVYNLGPTIVCDPARSTAARMLAAGDRIGACQQLPRWDKARVAGALVSLPGLTKRRAAEMRLCLQGTT